MNRFKYTLDNKRYHTFNYYLKTKYNCKVAKVIIDAHLTCPNIDGKKGTGGCTYCSSLGSGDSNQFNDKSIIEQYQQNKIIMNKKWENKLYIPYFQSHSNTYTSVENMKKILDPFIHNSEIAEVSIATRCDCLSNEMIGYLNKVSEIKPLWIELGLQTSNDKTEKYLNRCYTFDCFKNTLLSLNKTNIKICIHIINGLPFESEGDMLQTIKDINHLHFHAIKIHMLHVLKGTQMEKIYQSTHFHLLTKDEYINIVVKQLELLKDEIIIERLTSDPLEQDLLEPKWLINKTAILNDIDKLMVKNDTYQGKFFK